MSRRAFVGGGVAAAAGGVGLARVEVAAAFVGRLAGPGRGLTRSRFAPFVGSRLELRGGGQKASVRLIGVRDLPGTGTANVEHQFSVVLQSAAAVDWPQQTYELRGPGIGRVSLFAVPMAGAPGRGCYEVVVNNPIEATAG